MGVPDGARLSNSRYHFVGRRSQREAFDAVLFGKARCDKQREDNKKVFHRKRFFRSPRRPFSSR